MAPQSSQKSASSSASQRRTAQFKLVLLGESSVGKVGIASHRLLLPVQSYLYPKTGLWLTYIYDPELFSIQIC